MYCDPTIWQLSSKAVRAWIHDIQCNEWEESAEHGCGCMISVWIRFTVVNKQTNETPSADGGKKQKKKNTTGVTIWQRVKENLPYIQTTWLMISCKAAVRTCRHAIRQLSEGVNWTGVVRQLLKWHQYQYNTARWVHYTHTEAGGIRRGGKILHCQDLTLTCFFNASTILINIFISVEFYSFHSISQSNLTFHGHVGSPSVKPHNVM